MARIEIRLTRLLVLGLLLCSGATPAYSQTAQQIAKEAFRSTVLLVMQDSNGQPLSLGSGFFVREDEIATNLHVVKGAARGYGKLVGRKTKYHIEGITAVDPKRDLVILKVSATRAQALSLGNSDAVQVGESIYAVGNPQGLEGTFSQGIISSIREVGTDKLLQITAPISPGSSGGPVLNETGEVIGVSAATFKGGQNLNFAIPSNYLRALIGKTGPAKPLAQAKPMKPRSSILENWGGRNSEGVVGTHFRWSIADPMAGGFYNFSIRNKLHHHISNIDCLLIFYDREGNPIDTDVVQYKWIVPAGLAVRITNGVHRSVQELTARKGSKIPQTKVEIRILDFRILDTLEALAQATNSKEWASVLANWNGKSQKGVSGAQFIWSGFQGDYTFSLRNELQNNVGNVFYSVIFYDSEGNPIHAEGGQYKSIIPAGLAKRVRGSTDDEVRELTTPRGSKTPQTKVEIRVLSFQTVD